MEFSPQIISAIATSGSSIVALWIATRSKRENVECFMVNVENLNNAACVGVHNMEQHAVTIKNIIFERRLFPWISFRMLCKPYSGRNETNILDPIVKFPINPNTYEVHTPRLAFYNFEKKWDNRPWTILNKIKLWLWIRFIFFARVELINGSERISKVRHKDIPGLMLGIMYPTPDGRP